MCSLRGWGNSQILHSLGQGQITNYFVLIVRNVYFATCKFSVLRVDVGLLCCIETFYISTVLEPIVTTSQCVLPERFWSLASVCCDE